MTSLSMKAKKIKAPSAKRWIQASLRISAALICTGCAAVTAASPASTSPAATQPKISFELGPDGQRLPAPNKEAARNWPPELRHWIDQLLQTLGHRGELRMDTEELEKKLNIQFDRLFPPFIFPYVDKAHAISGPDWLLTQKNGGRSVYHQLLPPNTVDYLHVFYFTINTRKYCINPYEFAVYTGMEFKLEFRFKLIATERSALSKYEAGMFGAPGPMIYQGRPLVQGNPGINMTASNDCILELRSVMGKARPRQ
jgi:hypothetical protein